MLRGEWRRSWGGLRVVERGMIGGLYDFGGCLEGLRDGKEACVRALKGDDLCISVMVERLLSGPCDIHTHVTYIKHGVLRNEKWFHIGRNKRLVYQASQV